MVHKKDHAFEFRTVHMIFFICALAHSFSEKKSI